MKKYSEGTSDHGLLPKRTFPQGLKKAAEKGRLAGQFPERHTAGAKAQVHSIGLLPGINPRPTARLSFSAACKAQLP
jgi:hypothetical protein